MPIKTFAATTNRPSPRKGLYQRTSARSRQNHAPQMRESNPRIKLITGLARSSNNCHATPAQKSMEKKIPTNTIDVPRSPCAMMSRSGTPATSIGFHISIIDLGATRFCASTRASIITTVSFANSAG